MRAIGVAAAVNEHRAICDVDDVFDIVTASHAHRVIVDLNWTPD